MQMDVNYTAVELTRLVLPAMRARRRGRIINLSSVGGMMAMPTMAIYSASKFALEGATEALYYEVRPWNIQVSLIQPGFVHSESFEHTRLTSQSERSAIDLGEAYHAHYEYMSPFIARLMHAARATPDSIARKIVRTMHRATRRCGCRRPSTPGCSDGCGATCPRPLYHWFLYRSLPGIRHWGELPPPSVAQVANEEEHEARRRLAGGRASPDPERARG
jgi:hypothetical protein